MMKRYCFLILPVILMGLFVAPNIEQAEGNKKKTSSLEGTILCGDKEYPAANIVIILLNETKIKARDSSIETKTDANGNYVFNSVKAGRYTVSFRLRPDSQAQVFMTGFIIRGGKKITKNFAIACV